MHFCGMCKKSSFVIIWHFSDGQKAWGGTPDKNFYDETKILSGMLDIRSRTGDFNCIDNYKYYYSIIEKRKSKKIREN